MSDQNAVGLVDAPPTRSSPRAGRPRIVILMPVLDDWACFAALIGEISNEFSGSGIQFHICCVDDGSTVPFNPSELSLPPDSCISGIEVLRLALNLGHQRAIAVGLCEIVRREACDCVLVMDSDGEDRPDDIAVLLAAGRDTPGSVILAQRARRSESLAFRFWYRLYKTAFHGLTGQAISFGNYSLLPMPAARRLVHMPELWNNLAATIMRSRLPRVAVPTVRGLRYGGRSRMSLVSLIVHGLSALSVHTDTIFVRVLLMAGLVGLAAALGIVAVAVIRFATDLGIPGWATTAAGDLLIVLLQTVVIVVAACLTMLAGRSNRPIIPIVDSQHFIAARDVWETPVGSPLTQGGHDA
jgi:hypothetical protein